MDAVRPASAVTVTPLTTDLANEYFGERITADTYRGDQVMAAMCRILFDKRLEPKEKIRVQYKQEFTKAVPDAAALAAELKAAHDGTLLIRSFSMTNEQKGAWQSGTLEALEHAGFHEMKILAAHLKKHKIDAVIVSDQPTVAGEPRSPAASAKAMILMEGMNLQRWYAIAVLLSLLLSKWFREKPLTAWEKEHLIQPVDKRNLDDFQEALGEYAEKLDLRKEFVRRQLSGWEDRFRQDRIKALENNVREQDQKIEEFSREIGRLLAVREESVATLHGYKAGLIHSEPYLMNYFLSNPNLVLQKADRDTLDFYAAAWLTNWDPEMARGTFETGRMEAWLCSNQGFGISNEDATLLYKAIFLHETARVRLWSHYYLAMRGDDPAHVISGDACCVEIQHALPNPHHHNHSCLGTNRQYIQKAIIDRDIVGAVVQCESATGGLNLFESMSYQYFASDLFDPKFGEIIYIPAEDKFMTTVDAIAYLKTHGETKKEA